MNNPKKHLLYSFILVLFLLVCRIIIDFIAGNPFILDMGWSLSEICLFIGINTFLFFVFSICFSISRQNK